MPPRRPGQSAYTGAVLSSPAAPPEPKTWRGPQPQDPAQANPTYSGRLVHRDSMAPTLPGCTALPCSPQTPVQHLRPPAHAPHPGPPDRTQSCAAAPQARETLSLRSPRNVFIVQIGLVLLCGARVHTCAPTTRSREDGTKQTTTGRTPAPHPSRDPAVCKIRAGVCSCLESPQGLWFCGLQGLSRQWPWGSEAPTWSLPAARHAGSGGEDGRPRHCSPLNK